MHVMKTIKHGTLCAENDMRASMQNAACGDITVSCMQHRIVTSKFKGFFKASFACLRRHEFYRQKLRRIKGMHLHACNIFCIFLNFFSKIDSACNAACGRKKRCVRSAKRSVRMVRPDACGGVAYAMERCVRPTLFVFFIYNA